MVDRKRDKNFIRKGIRISEESVVVCDFLDFYAGYKGINKFEFYNNLFNYRTKQKSVLSTICNPTDSKQVSGLELDIITYTDLSEHVDKVITLDWCPETCWRVTETIEDDTSGIQTEETVKPTIEYRRPEDEVIQDTEEIIEESLSLEEKEKELITKALKKHNGKRKLAAQELGISERTLYRKIKEYDID